MLTRAELSGMRDRGRARDYSASRDEFRRDHERRRARGLQHRHAERLRHVRERQAGSFPADLRVPWAAVDGSRSGIADPSPSSTTRPSSAVRPSSAARQPAPARDPRTGRESQAGPAQRPGPHRRTPPAAAEPTIVPASLHTSEPRLLRNARLPGTPIPIRHHAPATDRAGLTTPHSSARPPHPDPARPAGTKPGRPGLQWPDPDQPTASNNPTTRTPTENNPDASRKCSNPRQIPRQHCQQISPRIVVTPPPAPRARSILNGMTVCPSPSDVHDVAIIPGRALSASTHDFGWWGRSHTMRGASKFRLSMTMSARSAGRISAR